MRREGARGSACTAYTMMEDKPHIRPLCAVSEDEGVSCLFMDEGDGGRAASTASSASSTLTTCL